MKLRSAEAETFVLGMLGVSGALLISLGLVYGYRTPEVLGALAGLSSVLLTGAPGFQSIGGGFSANIFISIVAMAISLVGGVALGIGLIAQNTALRQICRFVMNFFRNSPWLVVIYAMIYLIPYEIRIMGQTFTLSPTIKAIIGLSLPISANIGEVFRGGIQSVASGQWEAARSLGYSRAQILYYVITPQALPMMIPNLMTVYASLFIGTSLVVVTGTNDIISIARVVIASGSEQYATAIYVFILFAFFIFAFPIAMFTRWLEHRVRSFR